MFKKIFKSKKSGIPVINEILLTFLHTTPKPILFFIFILLITTITAFILPTILSFFGYICVPQGDNVVLYQVPANKIAQNIYLQIQQSFFSWIGVESYKLPDDPFPFGNKKYLKIPSQCFVQSKVNSSNYGYSAGCVNCISDQTNIFQSLFVSRKDMVCTSDGYALNRDTGVLPDLITFCSQCSPPEPYYYYNHTNCLNNPDIDTNECYFTLKSNYSVNDVDYTLLDTTNFVKQVISMGGVAKSQSSSDFINIQCEGVNKPQLYFFNMKIFDAKIWIYIGVGYILIMLAFFWYHLILK